MAQVVYSEEALADLERIVDFLPETSASSAPRTVMDVRSAVEVLVAHPLIGRRVEGFLRELVISEGGTGYLALYRYDAARELVLILRVRHQREAGYLP